LRTKFDFEQFVTADSTDNLPHRHTARAYGFAQPSGRHAGAGKSPIRQASQLALPPRASARGIKRNENLSGSLQLTA
jgi:hypothetical protein